MAKKGRKTTDKTIETPRIEIDYNRLADAIVRAQAKADAMQYQKTREHTRFRNLLFSFFNGTMFICISLFSLYGIYRIWSIFSNGDSIQLPFAIIATIALFSIAVVAFLCNQETHGDDYRRSGELFNSSVAFVALIIAILAFLRG